MEIITLKQFNRFLKANQTSLKVFITRYYQNTRNKAPFKDFFKAENINDLILGAFVWLETTEGHHFWRKLHDEWNNLLSNVTKEEN